MDVAKCPVCFVRATLRCSTCKIVGYCSQKHQKILWPAHKLSCNDNLKRDVVAQPRLSRAESDIYFNIVRKSQNQSPPTEKEKTESFEGIQESVNQMESSLGADPASRFLIAQRYKIGTSQPDDPVVVKDTEFYALTSLYLDAGKAGVSNQVSKPFFDLVLNYYFIFRFVVRYFSKLSSDPSSDNEETVLVENYFKRLLEFTESTKTLPGKVYLFFIQQYYSLLRMYKGSITLFQYPGKLPMSKVARDTWIHAVKEDERSKVEEATLEFVRDYC